MKKALITGITGQDGSYLVEEAFAYVGLDWQDYVEIDPRYFRPTDVSLQDLTPDLRFSTCPS